MEGHPAIPSHTWEISRRRVVFFGGRAAAPQADGLAVKSRRLLDAAAKGAAPRSRSREGTPDAITMAPGTRTLLVALGFLSPPTTHLCCELAVAVINRGRANIRRSLEIENS